ncbi:ATP-binding protein [Fructilactobacillus sp. Tb1]|uniref:ATP-binding protein n=1 Tax=Fructilactobacillus sp. Tb1 TaxID=3422304 RepID=UPI003D294CA4
MYLANKDQYDDLYLQLDEENNRAQELERIKRDIVAGAQQIENDNLTAGGNDSLPFSEADKQLVNDLNDKKQNLKAAQNLVSTTRVNNKVNNSWIMFVGFGVLVALLGFVLGGMGLVALLLVGIGLIGYGLYLKTNSAPVKSQPQQVDYNAQLQAIDAQLAKIAIEYQIKDSNPMTWTSNLQAAIIKRNSDRDYVNQLKQDLKQVSQQLSDYIQKWNLADVNPNEYNQALIQIKQFMRENERLQQKASNQKARIADKQNQLIAQQKEVDDIHKKQVAFLAERKLNSQVEFKQQYAAQQEAQKQLEKVQSLQNSLSAEKMERLSQYHDQADLLAKLNHLKQLDSENDAKLTQNSQEMSAVKTEINQLAKDGTYDELRQDLAIQKAEINDLVSKWLVLTLTDEWIEKVLNLASHGRFPQVQKLAQKYFNTLTTGHYVSVEYGKKIRVKTNDGIKFDVKELSRGTMQQLYLSLIFALTMSFSDQYPMPIIIDDGFVDFDQVRTEAAIELMKEISQTTQVIYFTADNRIETQVADANLIKLG